MIDPYQIDRVIKDLMNYQGLVNEGATCYLNSLLQTLFMTAEFRQNVYDYVHSPKKVAQKDSIPFQLQRLFANLQTSQQCCNTRDLLRSFQWTEAEAFQQHDVQEFCRLLFDAIELSHKDSQWIRQLFGFGLNSYIDCGLHRSQQLQLYLDLSLPVRHPYTKAYYSSIEQCLKEYLMPEKLEGVECSGCNAKVTVDKGLSFASLPTILTLQLNRFELNYENMQREKINSFLYFPEILQLHRFTKPYSQIQIRGIPKDLELKKSVSKKQASMRTIDFGGAPVKKRKNSDEITAQKAHVSYFDEQNKQKRGAQVKQLSKHEQKDKNMQILADLKQTNFKELAKKKKEQQNSQVMQTQGNNKLNNNIKLSLLSNSQAQKSSQPVQVGNNTARPTQKVTAVQEQQDMLFGTLAQGFSFNDTKTATSGQPSRFESTITQYLHEEEGFQWGKHYKQGTYALYAVLVHSGGSYGGHYYAYIFDGHNWLRFDDSKVAKVAKAQVRQYGSGSGAKNGTNAYMLFYRTTGSFSELKDINISEELLEKVKQQNLKSQKMSQVYQAQARSKQQRIKDIQSALQIKIHAQEGKEILKLSISDKQNQTMLMLRSKIREQLGLVANDSDWRLRRYNKSDDSMHEAFGVELNQSTLEQLGWRESMLLFVETKQPQEVFIDYDPRDITVRISIWQPNITMIAEKQLKPLKIRIRDERLFQEFYEKVIKQSGILQPLILKRNYMGSQPVSRLTPDNCNGKTLLELRFFNNINLYLEQQGSPVPRWVTEFDNQRYRCVIKFNHPREGQNRDHQVYFDSRRTLGELKKQIAEVIGLPEEAFRVKKGRQLPQLTAFRKKLTDLRFVGNEVLFIEEGRSAQGLIVVKRGQTCLVEDQIEYEMGEELQFQSSPELITVEDLCLKISERTGVSQAEIRVRQFSACQFRQIYSRSQLLQRIRQKSLIWEHTEQQRGVQVYYRTFDILTFEFGPLREVFADPAASYQELTLQLAEDSLIPHDRILVHKSLSSYLDKASMLDVGWNQTRYLQGTVREEPLLINSDGDILIVKAAEEAYAPPKVFPKKSTVDNKQKAGEARLKITVVTDKQEEQEQEQTEKGQQKQLAELGENKQSSDKEQDKQVAESRSQGQSIHQGQGSKLHKPEQQGQKQNN